MPTKDIQFPDAGVNRRLAMRAAGERRERYFSPWCVNVRLEDPLDRRLRGGSRSGLTKFVSTDMGSIIADMASIYLSSAAGATEVLFVLVDSSIKTIEDGVVTTRVAYLTNEAGDTITNEDEVPIVVSEGTAPASGFLVTGQQKVFAITGSSVVRMDPKTGQVDELPTVAGTIPTSCTFGAVYRDRLCLSGQDNAIYMSRQGVYGDFDFAVDVSDQARAIPFQLSLAADVGAAPTALIPCMDDYLICATSRSLWVVQGDPGRDGSLKRISESVGIVGSKAWVQIDGTIIFIARDGLYQVQADGSGLERLSEVIPDELRNVIVPTVNPVLGYDQQRQAFHIYLRTSEGSDTHWLFEVASRAFWPMRLQDRHSPRAVCRHKGELLLAGVDGYIRKASGDNDDGAAIQSHAILGPFRLGNPGFFGRILNMQANIATGSGSVNWRIVTGDTAEEAADNAKTAIEAYQSGSSYSSYVKGSGYWIAGRSVMVYPRVRGVWCCLWLQSTDQWAFEELILNTTSGGR